jgi:hypothetical protein
MMGVKPGMPLRTTVGVGCLPPSHIAAIRRGGMHRVVAFAWSVGTPGGDGF